MHNPVHLLLNVAFVFSFIAVSYTHLDVYKRQAVKDIAIKELSNKRLFVVDAFCGANKDTRMAIRCV